jgi:hypothetical protein
MYNIGMNLVQKDIIPVKNDQIVEEKRHKLRTKRQIKMIRETAEALFTLKSKEDVAKHLGVSFQMIYRRLKKYPEIEKYVETIKNETITYARNKLFAHTPISAENVISLADNAVSENVQLEANLAILDRAGITKPMTNNIQVNVQTNIDKQTSDIELD